MKQSFFILLIGMIWQWASAQPFTTCDCILAQARALANDKNKPDYESAIKQFNAARICDVSKATTIDKEVLEVFVKISKLKENADKNAKIAGDALTALKNISNQAVTLLLKEIDTDILYLDYDSTFQKCKVAIELKEQPEEVKKRIQEIAFWQVETDTADFSTPLKTLALLDIAPKQKDKATLQEEVKYFDLKHYEDFIVKRYFPEMIKVEGGEFMMGSENGQEDEKPVHKVKVNIFWMAKTECTVWQYHLYHRANKLKPYDTPRWQWQGDNPIVNVNWYDAVEYANWLSKRLGLDTVYSIDKIVKDTLNLSDSDDIKWFVERDIHKKGYRLPTETEWEYAARGGKFHSDFEYAGSNKLDSVGWYDRNSNSRTHKVGTKKANALGIFDMSGNVLEWCNDWYGEYDSTQTNNPIGAKNGEYRVLRGGSWAWHEYGANECRVSERNGYYPDGPYDIHGFRLCLGI